MLKVNLLELAPEINTPYREMRKLQRKMDRSRRANNPTSLRRMGRLIEVIEILGKSLGTI